jgi:hypothetical protein
MAPKTLYPVYVAASPQAAAKWRFRVGVAYELAVDRSRLMFTPRPLSQDAEVVTIPRGLVPALTPSDDGLRLTISSVGAAAAADYVDIRGGANQTPQDLESWVSHRLTSAGGGGASAFRWLASAWKAFKGALRRVFPCFAAEKSGAKQGPVRFQQTVERRRSLFGRKKSERLPSMDPFSLTSDDEGGVEAGAEPAREEAAAEHAQVLYEQLPPVVMRSSIESLDCADDGQRKGKAVSLDRNNGRERQTTLEVDGGSGGVTLSRAASLNVKVRRGSKRVKENVAKMWKSLSVSHRMASKYDDGDNGSAAQSSTYQSFEKLDYCFHIDEECPHCNELNVGATREGGDADGLRRRRRRSSAASDPKRSRVDSLLDPHRQSTVSMGEKFGLDDFVEVAPVAAGDHDCVSFQDWYYETRPTTSMADAARDAEAVPVAFDRADDTVIVMSDTDIYKVPRKSLPSEDQSGGGDHEKNESSSSDDFDKCVDVEGRNADTRQSFNEPTVDKSDMGTSMDEFDCVQKLDMATSIDKLHVPSGHEEEEKNVVRTRTSGSMRYVDNSASLKSLREHVNVANSVKKFGN